MPVQRRRFTGHTNYANIHWPLCIDSREERADTDFEASIAEHAQGYSVVSVRGEMDLHSAPRFQYAIERAVENEDLGDVAFMDSTALSALMRSKDTLGQRGISLRLAAPSRAVERIFSVTGFQDYFDVFPSREAAIPV
jgi:anti-sigma B factor antagonist